MATRWKIRFGVSASSTYKRLPSGTRQMVDAVTTRIAKDPTGAGFANGEQYTITSGMIELVYVLIPREKVANIIKISLG